ncbi:hypothetical protein [Streptomyces sp. NPDC056105]|uniref:hypothetical protein n=1 Tax=Streptomyces sp. NPDC056105 TaxID=3345714 RepID=UPI0035D7D240
MTDSPFAPLGRYDTRGQKCTYSPGDIPANDCQANATWHILWNATTADASLACDPHMAQARARFVFVDTHRLSPDCGMPNAAWGFHNKRCYYLDDTAEAAVIAGAAHDGHVKETAR